MEPVYSINGFGGEYIRGATGYYKNSSEEFITNCINMAKRHNHQLAYPTGRVAKRGLDKLSKRYPNISPEELPETLYREVRGRNHFGKGIVESYFKNVISLSPAIDSELNKIKLTTSECDDKLLLMAVIFSRYCPKLLDFKFNNERKIKEETIEYAKKLNKKYEFNKKNKNSFQGLN